MTTRGQTRTWWEATLTFSWRDAQCRSVCKSSQPSLLNLLLYNCHHCMRVHVHMCMYVNSCAHLYMKTWRPKMDSEYLPQSFSFDSLGRVSCWTHPSLANSSRACLASQLCSRTLYPWAPKLGWLVSISSTYFFFLIWMLEIQTPILTFAWQALCPSEPSPGHIFLNPNFPSKNIRIEESFIKDWNTKIDILKS